MTTVRSATVSVCVQGNCLHWLACSLYAACLSTKLETVSGEEASGSSVSLRRILRDTNLR